jgi:hypothetical protein
MNRFSRRLTEALILTSLIAGTAYAQQQGRRGDDNEYRHKENRTITVVCESRDWRRHYCAADTLGQITLGRQLTRDNRCVANRTWGYDSKGIWVDRGCRAEFQIADNAGTYRDRGPSHADLYLRVSGLETHLLPRRYPLRRSRPSPIEPQ